MTKPTFASVTEAICQCGHMDLLANDAATPIRFVPELNEYHIEYKTPKGDSASILILHCIFCGGAMPQSKRNQLFESIPAAEQTRLQHVVKQLGTLDDVQRVMGAPDIDESIPAELQIGNVGPGAVAPTRSLTYSGVSEVADIHISVLPDGNVRALILPKRKT